MKTTRALALSALLFPGVAAAGGYTLPVHGVRALGVGGALVAGAENMDAFWYNPSRLGDTSIGLEVSMIDLDATYTSQGQTVENGATPLPNPSMGAVMKINERLSVGLGAYAPWGAQYSFPENGPQRYVLVENDASTTLFVHAAVSIKIGDHLRLGGGVQNVIAHIRQTAVLSGYTGLFGHAEDPELDVMNEIELRDPSTFTANLGASYDAGPVTFGASVQLPYTLSGDGEFRVRLPDSFFFEPTEVEGNTQHIELPFPLMVRLGAHWRVFDNWSIEAAGVWEGWSRQQAIDLDPRGQVVMRNVPAIGDYVLKPLKLEKRMKDTLSLHVGTDVEVMKRLHVRGGVFYEPSAFGDETFSVAVMDDDKVGLALGVSMEVGPVRIDVAGSRVFQGTRVVTDSELTQINPTNPEQAVVVGNGTYTSGFWVAGAGVTWAI